MAGTEGWRKALEVLEPLDAQIDGALALGDFELAMQVAYRGAVQAVSLVADERGQSGIHTVLVELAPLPLTVFEDGTLGEAGAYVNLAYRYRDIAPEQAEQLAGAWDCAGHWAVDSS